MFWDTFLSVLGVIGIVAVASFVIVFLCDLFISIIDGTNGIFFKRNKNKDLSGEHVSRPKLLKEPEEYKEVEYKPVVKAEEKPVEVKKEVVEADIDLDEARREEELIRREEQTRKTLVEERRKEVITEVQPQVVRAEIDEADFEKAIKQVSLETKNELASTTVKLDEKKVDEKELDAEAELISQENKILEEKTKEQERIIAEKTSKQQELEQKIIALERKIKTYETTIEEFESNPQNKKFEIREVKVAQLPKEEIEERLEILRARLKDTEKELSANKKEFIPLRRVNKTLDSDKKKLRRREAIVAKQKVVLYGVNNYVDIDEEKAKKLSEELDLLEGLRLSVQHCEEVMQKNQDRYPILERANAFLTRNRNSLKQDIERLENQLKAYETDDDDENEGENN